MPCPRRSILSPVPESTVPAEQTRRIRENLLRTLTRNKAPSNTRVQRPFHGGGLQQWGVSLSLPDRRSRNGSRRNSPGRPIRLRTIPYVLLGQHVQAPLASPLADFGGRGGFDRLGECRAIGPADDATLVTVGPMGAASRVCA